MALELTLGLALAVGLFIYFLVALARPERF